MLKLCCIQSPSCCCILTPQIPTDHSFHMHFVMLISLLLTKFKKCLLSHTVYLSVAQLEFCSATEEKENEDFKVCSRCLWCKEKELKLMH